MSPTYISTIVLILAQVLPWLGIQVGGEALTTTASTLITVVAGVVILVRRLQKGDITVFGKSK